MSKKHQPLTELSLRRSVLFVPAANTRALEKAKSLAADCLILDLEDSVSPLQKGVARENIRKLFANQDFSDQPVIIRINDLSTSYGTEDLLAALACKPDAILLPKTSTPGHVIELASAMEDCDAPPSIKIWAMIETPLAILNIAAIAALALDPGHRLECLVMGPNDLARETGTIAGNMRQNHLPWLMQVIAAGRAYAVDVLDGVYNDFRDQTGFESECIQARDLGFSGKTLIHPSQIAAANEAFAPTDTELNDALAIVEAFSKPENGQSGVIQIGGKMVERLHLTMAETLIAHARKINKRS